jgi:hypothetical protein
LNQEQAFPAPRTQFEFIIRQGQLDEISQTADAHTGNQGNQGMPQAQVQFVITSAWTTITVLVQTSQAGEKIFDMATPSLETQVLTFAKSNELFNKDPSIKSTMSEWSDIKESATQPTSE